MLAKVEVPQQQAESILHTVGGLYDSDYDVNFDWDQSTNAVTGASIKVIDTDMTELEDEETKSGGKRNQRDVTGAYVFPHVAKQHAEQIAMSTKIYAKDSNLAKFINENENATQLIANSIRYEEGYHGGFSINVGIFKTI